MKQQISQGIKALSLASRRGEHFLNMNNAGHNKVIKRNFDQFIFLI